MKRCTDAPESTAPGQASDASVQRDLFGLPAKSPPAACIRKHQRHAYPAVVRLPVLDAAGRRIPTQGALYAPTARDLEEVDLLRPRTRGECQPAREALVAGLPDDDPVKRIAPCPWVGCKYHLHLDVVRAGDTRTPGATRTDTDQGVAIEIHTSAPWEHTCALDVIDAALSAPNQPDGPMWAVDDGLRCMVVEAPDAASALDRAWTVYEFEEEPIARLLDQRELAAHLDAGAEVLRAIEAPETGGLDGWDDDRPEPPVAQEQRDALGDEALADVLGISAEWVRQITKRALAKVGPGMADWGDAGSGGKRGRLRAL